MQTHNNSEKLIKIISIVICVLLLPILIINSTLIVKGLINKDEVPMFAGQAPLIVLSDSMAPNILSGDLIGVREVNVAELKVGDVIAFFDPASKTNSVVTHRIVEVVSDGCELSFRTKGDANNAVDQELVPAGNVVGIWTGRVFSGLGNAAIFLQSVPGLILCIGVPIVLLFAFEAFDRRKKMGKVKDENAALMAELEELRALKAERDAKAAEN